MADAPPPPPARRRTVAVNAADSAAAPRAPVRRSASSEMDDAAGAGVGGAAVRSQFAAPERSGRFDGGHRESPRPSLSPRSQPPSVSYSQGGVSIGMASSSVRAAKPKAPKTYVPQAAFYPIGQKSNRSLDQILSDFQTSLETGLTSEQVGERMTHDQAALLQDVRGSGLEAALRLTCRRVRRNGGEKGLPGTELVRGDVVILSSGDIVPSDCYIAKVIKNPNIIFR
eukprot:CAMPEP_0174940000 /NCGR_PEP_ID=MMETSP1355-20121228/68002_1 /TAXON_ID=464990 /ORGANISM="Hemiselmis tepida, Strain CCMP443" /LENGTH=226 /DNA_ID=CAMNT_0016187041 /DNA_START=19 /DNA_END=696 /DNA_ORIENTATION=-